MLPDLCTYDWIVISSSAGKDSQAMLEFVVERCDRSKVPREKLVVAHADLGRAEWPGTRELAEEQARHYGLTFLVVRRPQGDLLQHIRKRRMFPSPRARFCTSDHLCCQPHNMSYVARLVMWCRAGWHRIRTVFLWTIPTARLSSC